MLVSYSHKFIFIHTYKVAGTSVREALSSYAHKPPLISKLLKKLNIKFHWANDKFKIFPHHATAYEVKQLMNKEVFDSFFKFGFVRNPWDWQVSLYHFMKDNPDHFQNKIIRSLKSFEEYIDWRIKRDKHLQKDFFTDKDGRLIVDFIGKYERLLEDFNYVCNVSGITSHLPHLNISYHKDFKIYYNSSTIKKVAEHFHQDIELFGYNYENK